MDDQGNDLPGDSGDGGNNGTRANSSDVGDGIDRDGATVRRIGEPEIFGRVPPAATRDLPGQTPADEYEDDDASPSEPSPEAEEVERQLAHYAFVREEREREVRLLFRDVPADEVAAAFRAAGASLITVAAERAAPAISDAPGEEPAENAPRRRRKRSGSKPLGALSVRYFYSLGEVVYTITITATSGVVASVTPIFPVAALSERHLHERMAVVFQRAGSDSSETYSGD